MDQPVEENKVRAVTMEFQGLLKSRFELYRKADEGEEARGQAVPRMPSKAERQVHELTHFPYQPWCLRCIAGRGRDDYHLSDKHASRQEGKAEMPVISMDFCFSAEEMKR